MMRANTIHTKCTSCGRHASYVISAATWVLAQLKAGKPCVCCGGTHKLAGYSRGLPTPRKRIHHAANNNGEAR